MALTITIPGAVETTTGSTAPAVLTVGVGAPGQGVPPTDQANAGGFTTGSFNTTYYPRELLFVLSGVTYAVPARIVP